MIDESKRFTNAQQDKFNTYGSATYYQKKIMTEISFTVFYTPISLFYRYMSIPQLQTLDCVAVLFFYETFLSSAKRFFCVTKTSLFGGAVSVRF